MRERASARVHSAAVLAITLLLLCTVVRAADTLTGEARGEIQDIENDQPIDSASVTLTNTDRGWKKQAQSDANGNYVFIQLEPGNYSVLAEKDEYYSSERTDILIRLNTPKVVIPPFKLRKRVTTPTRQITVTSEGISRNVLIDATSAGPSPAVLATLNEPGQTALASTLDSTIRANFEAALIHVLPLRGVRSFDQLALFAPGVFRVPFSSGEGPAVGIGVGTAGQFAVNGMRGRSNNFTVDGSDNNDEDIGVRRQGFLSATPQTSESVEEFQVVTAAWTAEFGRNAGSVVNAVSRSGRNRLHGSVYGLFTNDAFDARNYFDQAFTDTINKGAQNGGSFPGKDNSSQQIGGVLGGPLREDRLFYFLSAERQRVRGSTLRHFVVPAKDERGLKTSNAFIPVDELGKFFQERFIPYSDIAGKGVFSLYPLPNNRNGPFGAHTYSEVKRHDADGTVFSYKSDYYLSSKHSLAGRYNLTDDHALLPFTSDAFHSSLGTATRTQNISLFLNSRFENFGSGLRISYGRTQLGFPPQNSSPFLFGSDVSNRLSGFVTQPIDTPYGRFGPFGSTGAIGQLMILPYSTVGIDVFNFPQGRVDNTYQFGEIATWLRPRHSLRAGVDVRRSQLNSFSDRNFRPLVVFGYGEVSDVCMLNPFCPFATDDGLLRGTDLAALGAPAGFLQTISTGPVPDSTIGLRLSSFDLFVQEDWKVRRNLTLNLGLRYELPTVAKETNGRIERTFGLRPEQFGHLQATGTPQNQQIINSGNRAFDAALNGLQNFVAGRKHIHDPDRRDFAPRVGLAWDPTGTGTTALRAGFGLFYDATLGAVTSQSRNVFPTFVPVNLDVNFQPPTGQLLNNPSFFSFIPTNEPLIRPGTLNTYNLGGAAFATGLGTLLLQSRPSPGASLSSNGLAFTLPEKEWRSSYAEQWTVSAERQFGSRFVASLGYMGTRGLHLPRFATPNGGLIATPFLISSFNNPLSILDLPPSLNPEVEGRPQPGLGAYTVFQNRASSNYHALQLAVEKRISRGLQFRGHWTWSHAIDEVSDVFDGRGFFAFPQDSNRADLERASSNFDVRHRLAGIAVWQWRNWTAAATAEFQTGQPFTINAATDRNLDGNLTDRVSGRNSSRADSVGTIDFAVERQISLAKQTSIALRMEAFNLLNTTSFGIPVRILESPGFGKAFDTQVNSRSIRFVAKVQF